MQGVESTVRVGLQAAPNPSGFVASTVSEARADGALSFESRYLGSDEIITSLEGGALEIGLLTPPVHLRAVAQGHDLRIVAANAVEVRGAPTRGVLVRPEAPIRGAGDLAGRTMAVASLGGADHLVLLAWLAAQGVAAERVQFVELPYPAQLAALSEGRLDAVLVGEPWFTIGESGGARRLVAPYAELGPNVLLSYYVATGDWLSRNRDLARRFASAVHGANARLQADPAERRALLTDRLGLEPALAGRLQLDTLEARVTPAQLQQWLDLEQRLTPSLGPQRAVLPAAPGAAARLRPEALLFETAR